MAKKEEVADKALVETKGNPVMASIDFDMEAEAGVGFEDVLATDLVLPQVKMLQGTSREVKRDRPECIVGAREGLWCDPITKELFTSIDIVPCKLVTHYVEWTRPAPGFVVKDYGMNDSVLKKCHRDEETGLDLTPDGTEIRMTAYWFNLLIGGRLVDVTKLDDKGTHVDISPREVMMPFARTLIKPSRQWASYANALRLKNAAGLTYQPPMFAMSYVLEPVSTSNSRNSWYIFKHSPAGWVKDLPNASVIWNAAKVWSKKAAEIHDKLSPVMLQEQAEDMAPVENSRDNYDAGPRSTAHTKVDDDIPF